VATKSDKLLVIGIILCALATVQGMRAPVVVKHSIAIENLPPALDGTTIVAVSDLHLGALINSVWLQNRLQQIAELSPDMVVFVGDIFDTSGQQAQPFTKLLRTIQAPLGVWAVNGNHEFYASGRIELFGAANIRLLQNSWSTVAPGLTLAGVDDLSIARRQHQDQNILATTLAERPQQCTILLSHSPLLIEQAADRDVDLIISGHTHNGQIWPFNYLVAQRYPYMHGLYRIGNTQLLVGAGTGTWGPRMRLWQPAEIIQIILKTQTAKI